jgi:hypothetical protein
MARWSATCRTRPELPPRTLKPSMKHAAIVAAVLLVLGGTAFLVRSAPSRASAPAASSKPSQEAPTKAAPDPGKELRDRRSVDTFQAEAQRRRQPLVQAVASEGDPQKRRALEQDLLRLDLELEIEGLRLKRQGAVDSGDGSKVADIDKLIALKRGRLAALERQ